MSTQALIIDMLVARSTVAASENNRVKYVPGSSSRAEWHITIDQGMPLRVSLVSIGSEAARILRHHRQGRVLAVFTRSVYVQYDQLVVCIGVASLCRGPLQVLIGAEYDVLPFELVSGVLINLQINVSPGTECLQPDGKGPTEGNQAWLYSGKVLGRSSGSCLHRSFGNALKLIEPAQHSGFGWIVQSIDWHSQEMAVVLSNSGSRVLDTGLSDTSIADISFADTSSADTSLVDAKLISHSLPALTHLFHWLENAMRMPVKDFEGPMLQVTALLGAGPGLTPSGDDLLAGVMLALHRWRRADLSDLLWQILEPHVLKRTNTISGAHLRMAAKGQCSEPVLSLLETVFNDTGRHNAEELEAIAKTIQLQANAIGASSGWDLLAGMSLVLRA